MPVPVLNIHLGQEGWHRYRPILLHIFNIEKEDQQKVSLLSWWIATETSPRNNYIYLNNLHVSLALSFDIFHSFETGIDHANFSFWWMTNTLIMIWLIRHNRCFNWDLNAYAHIERCTGHFCYYLFKKYELIEWSLILVEYQQWFIFTSIQILFFCYNFNWLFSQNHHIRFVNTSDSSHFRS